MNTKHSELTQTLHAFAANHRATTEEPNTSRRTYVSSRANQPSNKHNQRYVANELKCFFCNGTGHGFERCFKASDQDKERIRNDSQRTNLKGRGKPGTPTGTSRSKRGVKNGKKQQIKCPLSIIP